MLAVTFSLVHKKECGDRCRSPKDTRGYGKPCRCTVTAVEILVVADIGGYTDKENKRGHGQDGHNYTDKAEETLGVGHECGKNQKEKDENAQDGPNDADRSSHFQRGVVGLVTGLDLIPGMALCFIEEHIGELNVPKAVMGLLIRWTTGCWSVTNGWDPLEICAAIGIHKITCAIPRAGEFHFKSQTAKGGHIEANESQK